MSLEAIRPESCVVRRTDAGLNQALSNTMIGYWTAFAKTGDPNFSGAPFWPQYSSSTDEFQSLVPPTPMPEFNFATGHMCTNLWG